jgi:hypothetical protein
MLKPIDVKVEQRMSVLMPKYSEVPEEFRDFRGKNRWVKVVNEWFFNGLKNPRWKPKKGIDKDMALDHVSYILSSWEPKHEHKVAACAYLLSEFFDDVEYDKKTKE